MSAETRLYIISGHLMFSRGLESLLYQENNVEIVGYEQDTDLAIEQIKKLQPDVVILDSDDTVPPVTPILQACPQVKVIGLSLQNNNLYVYRASQWAAKGTEDLLKAIEDDFSST